MRGPTWRDKLTDFWLALCIWGRCSRCECGRRLTFTEAYYYGYACEVCGHQTTPENGRSLVPT